jgi:hypothetical protein
VIFGGEGVRGAPFSASRDTLARPAWQLRVDLRVCRPVQVIYLKYKEQYFVGADALSTGIAQASGCSQATST